MKQMYLNLFSEEATCGSILVNDHLPSLSDRLVFAFCILGGRLREVRLCLVILFYSSYFLISLYALFFIVIHFWGMLVYRPISNYKNSYLTPRLGGMNQRNHLLAQSSINLFLFHTIKGIYTSVRK